MFCADYSFFRIKVKNNVIRRKNHVFALKKLDIKLNIAYSFMQV